MALKSTPNHYGTMAVSIHWLSVVMLFVLITSGFRAANTVDPVAKAAILRVHVPIAGGVPALMILRIVWWLGFDRKPRPVPDRHAGRSVPRRLCMSCSTLSS
jgi:cytochrome b561